MDMPLEEKFIVTTTPNQKEQRISAIDQRWKEEIHFVAYCAPPLNTHDRAAVEEWLERAGFIENDLDTLLRLPHNKFWCQAIFDSTLHTCIDSYLKLAPRSHDTIYQLDADVKEKQDKLHRLVFLTCLRMATHKESKENFITPSVFGEILYENFLFDIPKLLDLCSLYGASNGPLLSKMINNIFTQQPSYFDDLTATVPTFIHVFTTVAKTCGLNLGSSTASPEKIGANVPNKNKLVTMEDSEFNDLLMYVSDVAHTLHAFLDVYPQVAQYFMAQEFPIQLVTFCECMVPAVTEAFQTRNWYEMQERNRLKQVWIKSQVLFAKIFREIVLQNCLHPLLEASSVQEAAEHIETFLNLITGILGERRFIATYETLYPYREDRDLITQSRYSIDETRLQFIQDGINEAYALYGKAPRRAVSSKDDVQAEEAIAAAAKVATPGAGFLDEATIITASRDSETVYMPDAEEMGACAPKVKGIELESMITSVKDLLPNLGEGFIELCLEELNYEVERVINAVLEDKLPVSLHDLDRTMKRDKSKIKIEEPALVDQRLNVYDNDEFDVFRRDEVDKSRIHKGKKTKVSTKDLDDKSYLKELKPLFDKYGSEFRESAYDDDRDYDDEYDDTYDTNLVGAEDADSADELTNRKPFTIPRVLGLRVESRFTGASNSDDASDGESEEDKLKKRDEFVQNPAEVRAKREARQAQKAARGRGAPRHDVKGREKGQGQDKDVLRNRAYKEKNKNKNRRSQADRKRAA